jgi:cytochrome c biogenesis protein CcdA/thiol-disulfide isomerase/thioredoxin
MRISRFIFLVLIFVVFNFVFPLSFLSAEQDYACMIYFTGVGCPHCANTDPVILEELLKEYPNLVIIEYEIYQQRENAPLIYQYNEKYNSGLGIPLIIFNQDQYFVGDTPILKNIRKILDNSQFNKCPLVDGSSVDFKNLDIASLPGFPKIWYQEKILIKGEQEKDGELLKKILITDNLNKTLKDVEFKKIKPFEVPLSGKYVQFDNGILIGDLVFQWSGPGLKTTGFPPEEIPLEAKMISGEPQSSEESEKIETNLTLPKILSLAVVDAVNPCALAVLTLMLIAILTYNPTKKKNVLWAGLAFVTSVFIMYLIYGLIIIESFQLIQALTFVRLWLYKILGAGAIVLGCFKIKDFFQSKGLCKISPRVDRIVSKVTSPRGAFLVGAFVTIFLLPCTIGPYIICGGILCSLEILKFLPWLVLYNLIFILPMIVVVLMIYLGMGKVEDISSWQAKNIRYLDLISGLIILGLGAAMFLGLV